ncbi:MAG: BrnA antitoxin family protein [Ruminococcus sp.]|nr:BrnA antitoxin family protein [Ruminococcus sp.]
MRDEYNIEELNPRKNPYAKKLRQQITINIDCKVIDFFRQMSADSGIPYQTLINLYLADCMNKNRKIDISWD